jgi:hypothetical protein
MGLVMLSMSSSCCDVQLKIKQPYCGGKIHPATTAKEPSKCHHSNLLDMLQNGNGKMTKQSTSIGRDYLQIHKTTMRMTSLMTDDNSCRKSFAQFGAFSYVAILMQ